jgi:hypothetical protein
MSRWQYCEAHWKPQVAAIGMMSPDGRHEIETVAAEEWFKTMARLGVEGWELVAVVASPEGREYHHYFKRPLA